jgi:2-oxoglutarate ferredoxin oxidoreductase subunit delta
MPDIKIQDKKNTVTAGKGRPEIDAEVCKGCELCIAACPQGVLKLSAHANTQGVPYPEVDSSRACTACQFCAITCPDSAIEIYRFEAGK